MKSQTKKISESFTAMTELVLPNDTNLLGNLMGGNLMRWMDIACGICASRHCEAPTVTVSVDHLTFQEPIKLGDIVTINASVSRTFTTSLEIFVEVFITNIRKKETGNPIRPTLLLSRWMKGPCGLRLFLRQSLKRTRKKMWEDAAIRRELRLLQSGRIQPSEATLSKNLLNS